MQGNDAFTDHRKKANVQRDCILKTKNKEKKKLLVWLFVFSSVGSLASVHNFEILPEIQNNADMIRFLRKRTL